MATAVSWVATPALAQTLRERFREAAQNRRADASEPLQVQSIEHAGMRRSYLVHVPPNLAGAGTPAPLVLAFHGGGGNAHHMADDTHYGLISKADAAGFIVVFPNGYSRMPGGKFATWNAGNCCGDARDQAVDDVGFVRALVQRLQADYPVDRQRIYATGMSNGGMMVHRLACEAPDIIAAVASVAGTDNTRSCTPSRPIAVLHIHARNDPLVRFDGGAGQDIQRLQAKVTDFTSVAQTAARWVARNQCEAAATRTLETTGAQCDVHTRCAGQAQVQLCVTTDGGHSWPGVATTRAGKEKPSQALSANDVVWAFFQNQKLP